MSYSAYITTLKEIRPHSNADRLNIATVFGQDVIVDKTYYVGQKVIFFPSDGQLSERFATDNDLISRKDENGNKAGGYLDPKKRNIKPIMLRGERSEGMVLPIECLSRYGDISKLKDGHTITSFGGVEICCKYVPRRQYSQHAPGTGRRKNKDNTETRMKYPYFAQHVDTEQLAYNQGAFHEGDTIYLTRKVHGTSQRTANTYCIEKKPNTGIRRILHLKNKEWKGYRVVSGTRRRSLQDYNGCSFYGSDQFREKWDKAFSEKLPKGCEVFYEVAGWVNESTPIMASCSNKKIKDPEFIQQYGDTTVFTYGCPRGETRAFVYRMTWTNEDGDVFEVPTEVLFRWCEMNGFEHVPLLDKFLYTTWDDLQEKVKKYLDIPEPLANGTHVVEGVVVRIDNRAKFTAFKDKSWAFKVLEGIIKDEATAPDMEEGEEVNGDEDVLQEG